MSNRKFHLFHLNLIPISGPLFQGQGPTREEYLRAMLEKDFEFDIQRGESHNNANWVYKGQIDGAILGILEKEVPYQHHLSPEEGGEEVTTAIWQGAFVMIDPTHHEKGQRASVEIDPAVSSKSLLKALFGHLNKDKDKSYEIIHEQIFDGNNFWNYAKEANNRLTRVQFDFVVPNMWKSAEKLDEELKEAGIATGAQRVTVSYQSSEGVDAESQPVKDGVKYIQRGAGKIKASASGLKNFDSDDNPATTEIPRFNTEEFQDIEKNTEYKDKVLGYDGKNTDNSDSDDTA